MNNPRTDKRVMLHGIGGHAMEAGVNWISVDDRLPDEKGEYLVAYHPCRHNSVYGDRTNVGLDSFRGKTAWAKNKFQRVTHWMPKPEPPKEVKLEEMRDAD